MRGMIVWVSEGLNRTVVDSVLLRAALTRTIMLQLLMK